METPPRTYQSRFGATRLITFSQLVAESICARRAKLNQKTLGKQFWNLPEWKREFACQVMLCNGLLARFSVETITAVLKTTGRFICTLRNPNLVGLLEAEDRRVKTSKTIAAARREESQTPALPASGIPQPRPQLSRPGNLFGSVS